MIKRALISVYDKKDIVELAQGLSELGVEIVSSSGTYNALKDAGIAVTDVPSITEFPECLGGRVKTIHPKIAGGILAIRGNEEHMRQVAENEIPLTDMVVLNLYPFKDTISKEDASILDAITKTDIGGPTNIRAAAKNYNDVVVIVDPADYPVILEEMRQNAGEVGQATKARLMQKVWACMSAYDTQINNFSPFL